MSSRGGSVTELGCLLLWLPAFAVAAPRLSISNAPADVVVSWPAPATSWVLEHASNFAPVTPWITVARGDYQTNGPVRQVLLRRAGNTAFYRLRQLSSTVPDLTGYWTFDSGLDSATREPMDLGGTMLYSNVALAPGRFGAGAVRFNGREPDNAGSSAWTGNSGYRVLPPEGWPFSVSLWLNPDALPPGSNVLVATASAPTNGWHLTLNNPGPGTNQFVFTANGETSTTIAGPTLLLPGQWYQVTVTYDGSQASIYLDAELLARGRCVVPSQEGAIRFGGGLAGFSSFSGRIDEVRTYARCLSDEAVSLRGHWSFDTNEESLLVDDVHGHGARLTGVAGWTDGRVGAGVDLSRSDVAIGNEEHRILPASGGAFSISCWVRPKALRPGPVALMSCGTGTNAGWLLTVEDDPGGGKSIVLGSTNSGGTLALTVPAPLREQAWTKLDLTYNGGIATLYLDGREAGAASGAIRGTTAPLILGSAAGLPALDATVDDLRIYARERSAPEIGPVAKTMWETVLINMETNLVLEAFGPRGKTLICSIETPPTNGTIARANGSATIVYRAGPRKGPDAFTYTVSDGEFTSVPAVVVLSVVQPHWLAPEGGSVLPLDGSSPERAWVAGPASALDAVWRTNRYYDCFFYAPGVYHTRGWRYLDRVTANPGCKHIGSGSTGSDATILRMVDVVQDHGEGVMFSTANGVAHCDSFEVHNMLIDCNATNLPKYVWGEPMPLRIPLLTNSTVQSVTLRWGHRTIPADIPWQLGRAMEFTLHARRSGTNTWSGAFTSTGAVDIVPVRAEADELLVELTRRAAGVDFYSVTEIEVAGAAVSLPRATAPGGLPSRLNSQYPFVSAVDDNHGTAWASGEESEVEIALPLASGTAVSQVNFHWHCQTFTNIGRLGPAAEFQIRARDENTGSYHDVPFVRHGRTDDERETVTFGTPGETNSITTDRLVVVLTSRLHGVDHYSLREVGVQNGARQIALRLPTARTSLSRGVTYSMLRAFDQNLDTEWAAGSAGRISAFFMAGNNLKFTRLQVIGFGTTPGQECFPMNLSSHLRQSRPIALGNILVEDCVFTRPAPNNKGGLTAVACVASRPDHLTNAIIRRCTVSGVASHFTYSHAFSAPLVEQCVADDCKVGVYFEIALPRSDYGSIVVRSNRFHNVVRGVYVLMHPGSQFGSLTCLHNDIALRDGGWGISACDVCVPGPSGSMTNLTVLHNHIRYANWLSRPLASGGGVHYSDIAQAVLGNNVIALGNSGALRVRACPGGTIQPPEPSGGCGQPPPIPSGTVQSPACVDALPPGYRRAWFNNRDLSGSLLEVWFSNGGRDVLALEQQWPE